MVLNPDPSQLSLININHLAPKQRFYDYEWHTWVDMTLTPLPVLGFPSLSTV